MCVFVLEYQTKGVYMKIYSITQSNQHQTGSITSFKGQFPISGGGGVPLVPEFFAEETAKKTAEGTSLALVTAEKAAEFVSLFGKIAAGFAAIIGLGAFLAHNNDEYLASIGDMDTSDVYNPDRDRMYM